MHHNGIVRSKPVLTNCILVLKKNIERAMIDRLSVFSSIASTPAQ